MNENLDASQLELNASALGLNQLNQSTASAYAAGNGNNGNGNNGTGSLNDTNGGGKDELRNYYKSIVQSSNENSSYLRNYMARKNTILSKKNGS